MFIALTTTCSESVGPAARIWRPAARCLGNVCYLHWPDVHACLPAQATQVCHFVSSQLVLSLLPLVSSQKDALHAACSPVVRSYKADRQWHIPYASFGTVMRTHAICNVSKDRMFPLTECGRWP
jgi:hypothetical protein